MQNSRSRYPALPLFLLGFLLVCGHVLYAGELTYLALQKEGQASIAIDEKKGAAYIIDLGRGGDGDQILIDNLPILDKLEQLKVKDITFICSHPHSDHMGGIRALFRQPRLFFRDEALTDPRFASITLVDDGVFNTLYRELQRSFAGNTRIRINHASATNRNAFEGISTVADDVHIETIPYRVAGKPGAHGRAVVTRIRLGQKHTIVDFDDADSAVILKVVNTLKARGETKINTVITAHHGSRYHEIAPVIDELHPDRAIIPVNPSNRYGHPAPPILRYLMVNLGKKNVIFTGSSQNVVLDDNGVKSALFTGANKESYPLFVAPNRIRAEKLRNTEDVKDCVVLQKMILGGDGDDTQGTIQGPRRSGGDAARTVLTDEVSVRGSILQPEFELAGVSYGRDGTDALSSKKIFAFPLNGSKDLTGQDVVVVVERPVALKADTTDILTQFEARGVIQKLKLLGNNAERAKNVRIFFSSPIGLRDLLRPALVLRPEELTVLARVATPVKRYPRPSQTSPRIPPRTAPGHLPRGGMVFLQGDKLFPVGEATELLGGKLDLCGSKYCVKTFEGAGGGAYLLPFSPGPLFSEVWKRVIDERVDSFYLSINPTKEFLRSLDSGFDRIPSDRLRFGVGVPGGGIRAHEVVTAGNIDKTQIGKILWEADVAFKSESLGFNVLTGQRGPFVSRSLTQQGSASNSELNVPYRSRWCRLYWTSGSQSIELDRTSKTVSFSGDAVIAKAEAMVLRGGKLDDEPSGTWCGDSKMVAESLQRQANSGRTALPVLKQLRQLAEIQSFVRWARENGITATDAFTQDVARHNTATRYEVPDWTSGIKTDPPVVVQQQRRLDRTNLIEVVHISMADDSVVTPCFERYWDAFMAKAKSSATNYDEVKQAWMIPHDKYPLIDSWVTEMAANISQCSRGVLLKTGSVEPDENNGEYRQNQTLIDYALHPQAVHMHGGVMLGMQRGFLEAATKKFGLLLSLDRRPYFQSTDGKLHFWNYINDHPTFGSVGQHVVIDGGSVTKVTALSGRLTFEITTQPGAVVLQESRWGRAGIYAKGFEWAGARHASDGLWIRADAAWPCVEGENIKPGCVQTSWFSLADIQSQLGASSLKDSGVFVARIDENLWRVQLDISSIRLHLDRLWKELPAADVNTRLSLTYEYAKWGFVLEALQKYAEFADKIEGNTEDTILRRLLEAGRDN